MAENRLPQWIEEHLRLYRESGGKEGHIWNGMKTLLLTTKGRKSGDTRVLPLIYGKADEGYVIVASKGGHTHHPSWYLNLDANPDVEIQVGEATMQGRARTSKGEERAKLWNFMCESFPTYNEYQARTKREIPVVVIETGE